MRPRYINPLAHPIIEPKPFRSSFNKSNSASRHDTRPSAELFSEQDVPTGTALRYVFTFTICTTWTGTYKWGTSSCRTWFRWYNQLRLAVFWKLGVVHHVMRMTVIARDRFFLCSFFDFPCVLLVLLLLYSLFFCRRNLPILMDHADFCKI